LIKYSEPVVGFKYRLCMYSKGQEIMAQLTSIYVIFIQAPLYQLHQFLPVEAIQNQVNYSLVSYVNNYTNCASWVFLYINIKIIVCKQFSKNKNDYVYLISCIITQIKSPLACRADGMKLIWCCNITEGVVTRHLKSYTELVQEIFWKPSSSRTPA